MRLKVLSLNFCDLPITNVSRRKRAWYAADYLQSHDYDMVIFQEAFTGSTRQKFKRALGDIYFMYPNYKMINFYGGLLAFINKRKFKVISAVFEKFSNTGRFFEFEHILERLCRKGYLVIKGKTAKGERLAVVNTHLYMGFRQNQSDWQMVNAQIEQLAEKIWQLQREKYLVICAGDYNLMPDHQLMVKFRRGAKLNEVFAGSSAVTISPDNINRKRFGKYKSMNYRCDYMFCSPSIKSKEEEVVLDRIEKFRGRPMQVSDHFGLACKLYLP